MASVTHAASSGPELIPLLPELGPRVVFFTGGTALRALSQILSRHTHNTVHLVTPFDSGGSSAALRRAFNMPAVGDIRNRLLALADTSLVPYNVLHICARRLPSEGDHAELLQRLYSLASEKDPAWDGIPRVFGEVLRVHLRYFLEYMPATFDPRQASMGNLFLAGGYLHHGRHFGPVLDLMGRLLQVRGTVLPIVNESLHLAAHLTNGNTVVGQHHITAHGASALPAPVAQLFLTVHQPDTQKVPHQPCRPAMAPLAETYIRAADAICYPMGSFYTSVLANLLPAGVGTAVAEARCPKFYIPNTGQDPEQGHLSVADAVRILLDTLRADAGPLPATRLLHHVLVDTRNGRYPQGINVDDISAMGVDVHDLPLVVPDDSLRHDPQHTAQAVLHLAGAAENACARRIPNYTMPCSPGFSYSTSSCT